MPFTPASLTGLVAWYGADSGVYNDNGSTLASDGQTVAQWNDQSGNGYNLGFITSKPTYNATSFNGHQTVTFTAAASNGGSTLSNVNMGSGNTGSMFAVATMTNNTANFGRLAVYQKTGDNDYAGAGSAAWILRDGTSNGFATYQGGAELAIQAVALSTAKRFGMIYDGTNVKPYLDNVVGTGSANSHNWGSNGTIFIGDNSGAWDGNISELVVTTGALDATDRQSLDDYFVAKWFAAPPAGAITGPITMQTNLIYGRKMIGY